METPNLKQQLRGKGKAAPVDQELRELRGFAVEIKQPAKPGDAVRQIADIIDASEGSSHRQNTGLPAISGHGGMQATFGSQHQQQYGNQGLLAVNPYDKGLQGMPYGTMQSMKDQYDHLGSYRGQFARAGERFTQINRTVGDFMSLQSRMNQDQARIFQGQQKSDALSPEQQLKMLKDQYMQAQQQQAQNYIGQRDASSIADPFETINETQTNSITDEWHSTGAHGQNFVTVPVPGEIRTATRERRTARAGRNTRSSQHKSAQLQAPETGERAHMRRVSQEVSQRSGRGDGLAQLAPTDGDVAGGPNTRRFQALMSRVIASVRTRTLNNKLDGSEGQMPDPSYALALPEGDSVKAAAEFTQTRPVADGSMMLSGQSSGLAGSEIQQLAQSLTPAGIRASARREVGLSGQKQSSDGMMSRSNQVLRAGSHSQAGAAQQQPRAAEQVAYLLKQLQRNKEQVFIPLEHYTAATRATTKEATILKESKHPDRVELGNYVFSQQGFVKLGTKDNPTTDFISKERYIQDGVDFMVIGKVPFFRKFSAMKTFKRWRYTVRARVYERNRKKLAENFIFARPMLAQRFKPVVERANKARFLDFLEIRPGVVYGKLQQFNLEQRCEQCCRESKASLQGLLTEVKQILVALKEEIELDDENFVKAIKHAEVEKMLRSKANHQAVVMFSKERREHEHVQRQLALSVDRQGLYNRLVQFLSRYLTANLVEMLYSNKAEFQRVFCAGEDERAQFEVSLCFNKAGRLDSDPSVSEHVANFTHIFQSMEDAIFKNSFLSFFLQDLAELFFGHPRIQVSHAAQGSMRRAVSEMERTMAEDTEYQHFGLAISAQLEADLEALQGELERHSPVQAVQDFTQEWNRGQAGRQLSLNMGGYNETLEKIQAFTAIIDDVPGGPTRLGTILLETMTLKKVLGEMPAQIMNSIRHGVTSTMENETGLLKEDLAKTSEILEQTPTSLNVYVEQVNTLKFVKQKQKDFDSKYEIIHRLKKQCQDDNITVPAGVQMSIHHVESLYGNLPKLREKAKEGLSKNKESMEKIMKGSSAALSKKIKAFERKYVENYLQDQSRLEDCSVTLEELFKRSTAIHEIKSKVMLYKEFLKLLYEDDPLAEEKLANNKLSCAEDCDFLQDVHKHTIRLWQNLLFWKKRKRMCYETPFLKLDLSMIQRSINKILAYFEVKLPANEFVHNKCQPLTRQIEKQVKETSVIVDFAKELHKDSLQRRHWVQFFTLIKAQHLKNSTTFTIIDLSEYKIQNYSEDIKLIINHAFTESRYENVFKSIKSEWEKAELRILPFKDSLKDYVIANTDVLSDSIEESLGTLETLHKSDYAAHVRKEIEELIGVLRQMLEHLDKWVQAQKYWVTLDPIYNSGLFQGIFGRSQRDFLETRAQFRRIMWSSYRNPQAMYNLLIKERTKVFGKLTEYYLVLQQKTHEYLEQKRLTFNRFFFLNDSQFLDFLMLANSNQDFSVYINILFQGAHNLFISQVKPSEHVKMLARADTLGLDAQIENDTDSLASEEDSDVEAQLEAFMGQALQGQAATMKIRDSQTSEDLARVQETQKAVAMPELDAFKDQNEFDPVFRVARPTKKKAKAAKEEPKSAARQAPANAEDGSELNDIESSSLSSSGKGDAAEPAGASEGSLSHAEDSEEELEADRLVKLQHSYVLGMLSRNRELFLFDRQVKMGKNIEGWLSSVEDAMRVSVRKHMKNAILRFASQPLEEWIGDYPQQVAISVLHLVVSEEISATLGPSEYEGGDVPAAADDKLFHEDKVTIGKPDPGVAKALANAESGVSAKSKNSTASAKGDRSSQEKSGKGLAGAQAAQRANANASEIDDYRSKILGNRMSNEPAVHRDEEMALFLDDAFGENTNVEVYVESATLAMRREENRMNAKTMQAKIKGMSRTKKADFKEQILACLQHKGLPSLWLRLAFWINKCVQLLHRPKQERYDKPVMNFELLGVHKMQIKSVILFLKYQQEMVRRLIEAKVTDASDFEWQAKLRTSWGTDDEGSVQCGGWSMGLGYEYLGTYNRLAIAPLTERYFVYMASSLREKSSVMFQCIPEHQFAASVVEEMASLCAVPFKTINCSEHTNLASLTQLLNGVAMSQVWVFLEFMDRLPLIGLSILLKEIQLIHQQFVVSQFQRAVDEEQKLKVGDEEEEDLQNILRKKPIVSVGIFGSVGHLLALKKPAVCQELLKQVRTSFRVITLSKPEPGYLFESYLYMENFTLPADTATLLGKFFEHFEDQKRRLLYAGEEPPLHARGDAISLANLRTALKLSQLLKDQEWAAYTQRELASDREHFAIKTTLDKFEVETREDPLFRGRFAQKHKAGEDYRRIKRQWDERKAERHSTKLKIELDGLREGFRVVVKNKVMKEWRAARFAQYRASQGAMVASDADAEMIDTQNIEAEIDEAIVKSYHAAVSELKSSGGLERKSRTDKAGRAVPKAMAEAAESVADDGDASLASKAEANRRHRLATRRDSLIAYKSSATNVTPQLRKGPRRKLKHASTVDLHYNVERERREAEFREALTDMILKVADELKIDINMQQIYNCQGIAETMRRNKGIVVAGPQCSGKTQLVKIATIALKRAFNVTVRSTFITPETFSNNELYGPTFAFQTSHELAPEQNAIRKSVFDIVLGNYAREKEDLRPSEANRLVQSIYIDSHEIDADLGEAVVGFLRDTNTRERDYHKDTEFILSFSRDQKQIQQVQVQHTPMRFPNGNVIMMPSDLFFFFECISLENISPVFLSNVGVVNTQRADVTAKNLFERQLQLLEKKHAEFIREFTVDMGHFRRCAERFVMPFVLRLDEQPLIQQWSLWNTKALTLQFFVILNAFIYRLEDNCRLNLRNDDPMDYPFAEMEKDIVWNCMLVATTWSFGAVLDKELRRMFEEQFGPYRSEFNITFATPMKQRFTLFEVFFDVERLTWALIGEKLDYKIKVHFNAELNQCVLPTNEVSQAYFVSDYLIYALGKEKDLNKNIRLIGPQSSSKTVILNTFERKLPTAMATVSIPMTAYLTMDRLRQKIEERYVCKRKNTLIPADPTKRIVLVIDDIHLQRNLKVEVLEFIRAWTTCRGYFDVAAGYFKKVGEFGTIMAENSEYVATSGKKDRFAFQTTTVYCEEISIESSKPFVQTWFTTDAWPTSTLITKYYILMTNALDKLLKQMKRNEGAFATSSLSKLHRFQYIAKFCSNVVTSSVNTEKEDVFCYPPGQASSRREEDALADIFCYEAMRCFGDRIMRPKPRSDFIAKLADICQKEFLCDSRYYTSEYIGSLVLGNYHVREAKAHVKLMNLTLFSGLARVPEQDGGGGVRLVTVKQKSVKVVQEKTRTFTGNQLLQTLLDMPTGLNDLFRISRIYFKDGQNLAIVGLAGSGKHELLQLSAILNDVIILEVNVPCFGQPLKFVKAFKDALKTVAKVNQPTVLQISETQLRDPVYFDYVYTYLSSIVRMDECVLFDEEFKSELAEIEAQAIRKLKKVTVPDEATCFKQAVEKIRKALHIVFLFSDLMSYKEVFQLFPQLEYLCEVLFLDDLTPQGYHATADAFLERSNIARELQGQGDVGVLSKSLYKVHTDVLELLLSSFYSSKMKENISWEVGPGHARCQFVFPDKDKLSGNVFAGAGGFTVADSEFRQTLFNMPVELGFMGKHRFAMFLEVFRFVYDLLSMHMQTRKRYYETFKAKSQQFLDFYKEVKAGKQYLHDEQTTKKLKFAQCLKKIEETQKQLQEKQDSIGVKEAEIEELRDELEIATNEIDEVIKEKDFKLTTYLDKLIQVNKSEFDYFLVNESFSPEEEALLHILSVVEQVRKPPEERHEYTKSHFDLLFYHEHKDELQNMLSDRRRATFDEESFDALSKFIKSQPFGVYNDRELTKYLHAYFKELYYKLNIKNTMATTYFRIQEIKMQIDSNIFSVNYAKQSIQVKQEELANFHEQRERQKKIAKVLSSEIEEAQISHMRTEAIEEHIWSYTGRVEKKLANLDYRVKTLLGDSMLMAASVVYLGPFAPEEREECRNRIRKFLEAQVQSVEFNFLWKAVKPQKRDVKPQRNIFWHVLKDIGLKEVLSLDNLPGVLSPNDLAENLFTLLFAPSVPVVSDPSGQLQEFVKRTFMPNTTQTTISAADIFANEKLENCIKFGRMQLVTDLNCMRKMSTGLSQDLPLMKRLATTTYNGFDFHEFRTAQIKKIGTHGSFFTHQASVNKRVPCFDEKLENISLYQVMVFQPKFDFHLNAEFLQSATFVSAAPSHQSDSILENNPAIVELKEIFMRNLLVDTSEFERVKARLRRINERMQTLESNFENSFLIASSETLKKLVDYKQLMDAVTDVNNEKEEKKRQQELYQQITEHINLLTEVSKVIFQIFMALKFTSKIMNETTYSWKSFASIVDQIVCNIVAKEKVSKAGRASTISQPESQSEQASLGRKQSEVEIEIDDNFFSKKVIPMVHKVMMSNVKIESKSFFNFVLSLRLALLYNSVTIEEHQLVLNQLILLKGFWKWRDPSHQFVDVTSKLSEQTIKDFRVMLFKVYPEALIRKVFEHLKTTLGVRDFTYQQLSLSLQTQVREKFGLSPVQMITFGFMCPDHEFQARMTAFMYQQLQATFDFVEDLIPLKKLIKAAEWRQPISLFSAPAVNPINLVTSIAKHFGLPLTILRTDPVVSAAQAVENIERADLRDMISGQLLDLANMRYEQKEQLDLARFENLAQMVIHEPASNQVIAKQNWRALKERNVNLEDSTVTGEINFQSAQDEPVEKVLRCARSGSWVLICPVQFPQYFTKLSQALKEISSEIHSNFRLIIDFQGFTQNEIPDSLIAEESVTMHLDETNIDAMPSFSDVWTQILEKDYLNVLTDQAVGQQAIRGLDLGSADNWNMENYTAKNMKYIYKNTVQNETMFSAFKEYLHDQQNTFQEQLEKQRAETRREMEEERLRAEAEEEARQKALLEQEQQLEAVNEEEDDGAFSNASDRNDYRGLMEETEHTQSAHQGNQDDEMLKNERNSEDATIPNIPVSSRGTGGDQDAPPQGINVAAFEENKESQHPLSEIVPAKDVALKRTQTMQLNQDGFGIDMTAQQADGSEGAKKQTKQQRINSEAIKVQPQRNNEMMVTGQGYHKIQSDPNVKKDQQ